MSNVTLGLVLIFLLATVMSLEDAGKWIGAAVWPLEALVDWISGLFSARKARPLKIRQLSPKEARRLSAWLARWQRLRGDATADHDHVEDAIAGLYDLRGSPGLRFRWVDSPGAALSAGVRPVENRLDPIAGPRSPANNDLTSYDELNEPRFALRAQQIGAALSRLPRAFREMHTILSALEAPPIRLPAATASATFHDTTAFLACCRDVLGVRYNDFSSKRLDFAMGTARSMCWWWLDETVCVVSEKPTIMHRDEGGLLHHPTGAAVSFRDGVSVYAWHGTAVPGSWITSPETLRPLESLRLRDPALRRAAIQIMGWRRVLEDLDTRTIDTAADPAIGQLFEANLPLSGRARFLRVRCGTGREFVLAVPSHLQTALEANAWTYDLSPNEYKLEVRT